MPRISLLKRRTSRHWYRVGRSRAGLGLFALRGFKRGEFIANYVGRLITNKHADELWTKYLFEINNRWTLDGSTRRNIARYINHSCKPNAETDVRQHKVIITAMRTIHPGDEITYNYGRNYFNAFIKPHGCRCAACKVKKAEERAARKRAAARKAKRRRA